MASWCKSNSNYVAKPLPFIADYVTPPFFHIMRVKTCWSAKRIRSLWIGKRIKSQGAGNLWCKTDWKANGYELYYYDSSRHGEVDFVVSGGVQTRLVEVKSGNDYKRHKAMDNVMAVDAWKFQDGIVLCKGNVAEEDGVLYLPWYMMILSALKKYPRDSFTK